MKEHELRANKGAHRRGRRVGRGDGSGRGTYSGRGLKGQKSRSGGSLQRGFAGGQLALMKSLPMLRGFTNNFRTEYVPVNLERLAGFPQDSRITPDTMKEAGILKSGKERVKVLGKGALKVPLTVVAHRFSTSARAAIEAAGGSAEDL